MMRYSVQPGDYTFAKDMGKNVGKKSKNLRSKHSQKLLDHAKQSAIDARETASKKRFKKQQK